MTDPAVDLTFSLADRRAVITGGGSGIGAAIADAYAAQGAIVAVLDINGPAAIDRAGDLGPEHLGLACDVTDPASVTAAVTQVHDRFGRIDLLVNSAGVAFLDPAEDLTADAWNQTLAVNLTGTFTVCQAVGRIMLAQRGGKIINLASQAASVALTAHAAYCASKAGLLGLTRVLASEWADRGLTVNSISPTVVLTELGRKAWSGEKGELLKAQIPTGRFAYPGEVAACAVFLGSGAADMINGADLLIDGGYTAR